MQGMRSQHHPRAPQVLSCPHSSCRRTLQGPFPHCSAQPWWLLTLPETAPSWQQHGKELLGFWSFPLFAEELQEEVICQGAFKHRSNRGLGPGGTVTFPARSSSPVPGLFPERPRGTWSFWKELGMNSSCWRNCWASPPLLSPSGNSTQVNSSTLQVKPSCSVRILLLKAVPKYTGKTQSSSCPALLCPSQERLGCAGAPARLKPRQARQAGAKQHRIYLL